MRTARVTTWRLLQRLCHCDNVAIIEIHWYAQINESLWNWMGYGLAQKNRSRTFYSPPSRLHGPNPRNIHSHRNLGLQLLTARPHLKCVLVVHPGISMLMACLIEKWHGRFLRNGTDLHTHIPLQQHLFGGPDKWLNRYSTAPKSNVVIQEWAGADHVTILYA